MYKTVETAGLLVRYMSLVTPRITGLDWELIAANLLDTRAVINGMKRFTGKDAPRRIIGGRNLAYYQGL